MAQTADKQPVPKFLEKLSSMSNWNQPNGGVQQAIVDKLGIDTDTTTATLLTIYPTLPILQNAFDQALTGPLAIPAARVAELWTAMNEPAPRVELEGDPLLVKACEGRHGSLILLMSELQDDLGVASVKTGSTLVIFQGTALKYIRKELRFTMALTYHKEKMEVQMDATEKQHPELLERLRAEGSIDTGTMDALTVRLTVDFALCLVQVVWRNIQMACAAAYRWSQKRVIEKRIENNPNKARNRAVGTPYIDGMDTLQHAPDDQECDKRMVNGAQLGCPWPADHVPVTATPRRLTGAPPISVTEVTARCMKRAAKRQADRNAGYASDERDKKKRREENRELKELAAAQETRIDQLMAQVAAYEEQMGRKALEESPETTA